MWHQFSVTLVLTFSLVAFRMFLKIDENIKMSVEDSSLSLKQVKSKTLLQICESSFLFEVMGVQHFKVKEVNADTQDKRPTKLRFLYMIFVLTFFLTLVLSYIAIAYRLRSENKNKEDDLSIKNLLKVAIGHALNVLFVLIIITGILQSFICKKRVQIRRFFCLIFFTSLHISTGIIYFEKQIVFLQKSILGFFPTFFLVIISLRLVFNIGLVNHSLQILTRIFVEMRKRSRSEESNEASKASVNRIITCRK
jgi:hypothetical protein